MAKRIKDDDHSRAEESSQSEKNVSNAVEHASRAFMEFDEATTDESTEDLTDEPVDELIEDLIEASDEESDDEVEDLLSGSDEGDEAEITGIEASDSSVRDAWDELSEATADERDVASDSVSVVLDPELQEQMAAAQADLGDGAQAVEIEELEFIEADQIVSIVESILFATDKPLSFHAIKQAFQGTDVKNDQIRRAIQQLAVDYAGAKRGVTLEEIAGGYQLRTKVDNMTYMRRMVKQRPFKLSGPALEVLSIVAYKQPLIKAEIDQIRGVESGHLLRALMEKGIVHFAGKSDLPGKPMQYATGRRFLEIFGLRNLKELPSLSEIDDLIPQGIGDEEVKKTTLDQITGELSTTVNDLSYSMGEEELTKIAGELAKIDTTTEFFEQEKQRERDRRDAERAQNIREAQAVGEPVDNKDIKWLERYDKALAMKALGEKAAEGAAANNESADGETSQSLVADVELEAIVDTEAVAPEGFVLAAVEDFEDLKS